MQMKKLNIARAAFCLVAISVALSALLGFKAFAAESGKCGENLKWSYSAGTLTISGKGKMQNYSEANKAPWSSFSDEITAVVLPEKLESVGTLAFYNCTSLKAISIPDKVEIIYDKAFYNCTSLRLVDLSNSLKTIGRAAFYNCQKLEALSLPDGLEKISDKAFYLCRSIVSITVPQSVKSIGKEAFAYCESLLRVEINAEITAIPEWCFYGCSSLAQIKLPETVTEIETYAFRRCNDLYTVYHSGGKDTVKSIRNQISEDVPELKNGGYVGAGELDEETRTSDIETDKNGALISQTNSTVKSDEDITLSTSVTTKNEQNSHPYYSVHIILTIEGEQSWGKAIIELREALSKINDSHSLDGQLDEIRLTLYLKNTYTVNKLFLQELAGRKMTVEVVDASGSIWFIDCSELKFDEVKKDTGVTYTVSESTDKTNKKLGTENGYQVTFKESSSIKTNVVIKLPDSAANSNAFLYQLEGGKPKRLQASVVDANANARFYVSSINKNTKYVIGINVPNESVDDIIIPTEASDPFGAIARLEKIEYVSTGVRRLGGFTFVEIFLIVIGLLVFISVVVGVVMYMMYKKNPNQLAFAEGFIEKAQSKAKNVGKLFTRKNKKQ
ncbi:MAG: leucine-rich repeat domain-containing protein [Ruminococcaceae bacterium]|nr:leucine-rich repeat domain-containing protein [Oscillospiraceae bacterium]